jgi:cytochrome P450
MATNALADPLRSVRFRDIPVFPGGHLFTGHSAQVRRDTIRFMLDMSRSGLPAWRFRFHGRSLLYIGTPELVHDVLVQKGKSFEKSDNLRALLHALIGDGLIISETPIWRPQRKLMAPLFQHSQIARYADAMYQWAERVAGHLPDGQQVEIGAQMTRVAMGVVGSVLFDAETFDESDELARALSTVLAWIQTRTGSFSMLAQATGIRLLRDMGRWPGALEKTRGWLMDRLLDPPLWPTARNREYRRSLSTLNTKVQTMIDERRRSGLAKRDLLTLLLAAQDEESGSGMSDKQVRDEAMTLFVAGHETTAIALSWAWHLLAQHPDCYARLRAEADALGEGPIGAEDLPRLPYALQVFKETMRLYPPVPVLDRQAVEDVQIGEYEVPRGTVVILSPYALHRRPELYPEPELFLPDRFRPEEEAARPKSAYLPFAVGPRVCIGNHFASMEAQIVLATMARRAVFERTGPLAHEPNSFAVLRPRGGVQVRVRLRGTA